MREILHLHSEIKPWNKGMGLHNFINSWYATINYKQSPPPIAEQVSLTMESRLAPSKQTNTAWFKLLHVVLFCLLYHHLFTKICGEEKKPNLILIAPCWSALGFRQCLQATKEYLSKQKRSYPLLSIWDGSPHSYLIPRWGYKIWPGKFLEVCMWCLGWMEFREGKELSGNVTLGPLSCRLSIQNYISSEAASFFQRNWSLWFEE